MHKRFQLFFHNAMVSMKYVTGDKSTTNISHANIKIHISRWKKEVENLSVSKTYVIEIDKMKLF